MKKWVNLVKRSDGVKGIVSYEEDIDSKDLVKKYSKFEVNIFDGIQDIALYKKFTKIF